jgi:preprotein translocase subunit SecF
MLHLISSQRINSRQRFSLLHAAGTALAGAMAFYTRGDRNFGVDFRGGDLVTMSAPDKIDIGEVRNALKPIGFGDASIQEFPRGKVISPGTPLNTRTRWKIDHTGDAERRL